MPVLPRPASPRALIADIRAMLRVGAERRVKLLVGALSIGMTSLIVTLFILESRYGILPEGPQITYAQDWAADRSDAEIIAQQKIDQKARDTFKAEKRAAFQRVDRAMTKIGL